MRPLQGIKVLDLTRVLAGPYCTMILADFGADVMKIEPPKTGDDARAFGPFVGGESAYYMSLNRNKRSMILDFKNLKHVAAFKEMITKADVVVENYRPGTMEKFGLSYGILKEINPSIIYAACSGFGHSGPYSHNPAYDIIVQAMGGIMSITGDENGAPTRVGASVGDITAGVFTALGIMLALYHREQTNEGQLVDVAMMDCQVSILENAIARYVTSGVVPKPIGNRHPSITPFSSFTAQDGPIIVAAANDRLWKKLCDVLKKTEWLTDKRFIDNPTRTKNFRELHKLLDEILSTKPILYWKELLDNAGIPCSPINDIADIINDPQIKEREMIVEVNHPTAGKLKMPGIPIKMSSTPGLIKTAAPLLGHDTNEILKDLMGWDAATVEAKLG